MKRQFSIILAAVLLGLVLAAVPVKAQVRTIADIREDLQHLLTQLYTIDNACVIILAGLLNEALVDILDTRKLITVGKGNLSPLVEEALQDALTKFDLAERQIDQCSNDTDTGLIDTFAEELGSLQEEIIEVDALDVRKRNKINALLVNANGRLGDDNVPADPDTGIRGRLADVVELCLDATAASGSARDLVNDAQSIAQNASADWDVLPAGEHIAIPNLTEKGPITFEELRTIKIELGQAAALVKSCLRAVKEITKEKKWIFKALREVYNLLRASNFGGRRASEPSNVTQVYALSGALIETQLGGLNTNRLPIGVYLTVTESRDVSGKVHQQVRKVTVVR